MIDLLMMARIFFTRNVVFVFALPSRHFSNGPSLILNNTSKIVALKKKKILVITHLWIFSMQELGYNLKILQYQKTRTVQILTF